MPILFGVMDSALDLPPITSGLVGNYTPSSLSIPNALWYDNSGNNNHASLTGSGHSISTTTASVYGSTKAFQCVTGARESGIVWPTAILPSTYTLFYVARYNTANATTASTRNSFYDGSSTSGFGYPFGNGSLSTNGVEVRNTYTGPGPGDIIWHGVFGVLDSSNIQANSSYLMSWEQRVDTTQLANGSNTYDQQWDSANFAYQEGESNLATQERILNTHLFRTGSSFALGNRWVRGFNNLTGHTGTSSTFFRNYQVYKLQQDNLHQIFTGFDRAWYSGFFAGNAGVAYHGNTLNTSNLHSNNWVLGTDQNAGGNGTLFRTNKVDRYNSSLPSNPGTTYARMSVNHKVTRGSPYQIGEVLVYNRTLNATEYQAVENYLSTKYGV
jgi:hypothetical protein